MWASAPNQVLAIDFQFGETSDGRRLKPATVDELTREALAVRVKPLRDADQLVEDHRSPRRPPPARLTI